MMDQSSGRSHLPLVDGQKELNGGSTKANLDKIKKQLSAGAATMLLQGRLFKRSETLRKWNQRWFTLDPSTARMDYRIQRGDPSPKGIIIFDADSTITMSPLNIHGSRMYDGCCFYIGTPNKEEYFLCADTPVAARAWVAALRAAALVLKAHKEAVSSLSGNGSAKLGTVAAVIAAANATAKEAAEEIAAEMQTSMRTELNSRFPQKVKVMDDLCVMKETLRVKDEELYQLAKELRAKDLTIKELADRLSETAEAANAAASAAQSMDKERKAARAEAEHLHNELDERLGAVAIELRTIDERCLEALKARDSALHEAQTWRKELAKAREHVVIMEAAVLRAEESARQAVAEGEEKLKFFRETRSAPTASEERNIPEDEILKAEFKSTGLTMSEMVDHRVSNVQTIIYASCNPVNTNAVPLQQVMEDAAPIRSLEDTSALTPGVDFSAEALLVAAVEHRMTVNGTANQTHESQSADRDVIPEVSDAS
ncbi:hypothetical protein O6H91_Y472600 [Diphasiastrum complanatum]|nr:hypothetical protein O6H91_Y472600 [Diphasiastrum complanatum]